MYWPEIFFGPGNTAILPNETKQGAWIQIPSEPADRCCGSYGPMCRQLGAVDPTNEWARVWFLSPAIGTDSGNRVWNWVAKLHRLAGRYDNPLPTRFLAPIAGLKLPAQRTGARDPTTVYPMPANACDMGCNGDGMFKTMTSSIIGRLINFGRKVAWDVLSRVLSTSAGHITLGRFVTFPFCALGHFVAASFQQHTYPNSTSLQYSPHGIFSLYILLCGEKDKESMLF